MSQAECNEKGYVRKKPCHGVGFLKKYSLIVKILLQEKNKKHLCLDINKLWYNYI